MTRPPPPPPEGPGRGWEAVGRRVAGEPPAPVPRCGTCGARLASDQTYCMECGTPTALAPTPARPSRATALVAGAVALLAVGTGALAYAVAADDETTRTVTSPAAATAPAAPATGPLPPDTSAGPVAPPAGTFPTVTSGAPAAPPATTPPGATLPGSSTPAEAPTVTGAAPPFPGDSPGGAGDVGGSPPLDPAPAAPPASGASDWPAGRTGWTVQVASSRDRSEAQAVADRLSAAGEPGGVLVSSDHPELRPGYFVAFSGVRASRAAAIAAAADLRGAGFPGAFARQISGG